MGARPDTVVVLLPLVWAYGVKAFRVAPTWRFIETLPDDLASRVGSAVTRLGIGDVGTLIAIFVHPAPPGRGELRNMLCKMCALDPNDQAELSRRLRDWAGIQPDADSIAPVEPFGSRTPPAANSTKLLHSMSDSARYSRHPKKLLLRVVIAIGFSLIVAFLLAADAALTVVSALAVASPAE